MSNQVNSSDASGIKLVGDIDPRSLNLEQFEKNPNLLYHPCFKPFAYSQKADANISEYFLENNNQETLGEGFYTTPIKIEAESRSKNKMGNKQSLPIILTLLPYQMRMYDMRDKLNNAKNGSVPFSMRERWLQNFNDYIHSQDRINLPWTTTEVEDRYFLYLKEVVRINILDLRVMLGTVQFPQSPNIQNPSWSKLFSNFMKREGLDGVIYNEASTIDPQKSVPIFVFYDISKLGTFESWHDQQISNTQQRPS